MTNKIEIKRNQTLAYWVMFSFAAWPLAFCAIWLVVFAYTLMWINEGAIGAWFELALYFIGAGTLGSLVGISVGVLQRLLLRRYLFWTADHWVLSSSLGGALGGIAVMIVSSSFDLVTPYNITILYVAMPLFTGLLSLVQCLSLRQATRKPWMWFLANVVAGMVFSNLIFLQGHYVDESSIFIDSRLMMYWSLAVCAQGLITGIIMIYLFERQSYALEPLQGEEEPKSVWDRAI